MDIGNIEETKYKVRIICKNWNIPFQDRADCVQTVLLKRIEGKARHQFISHSVVDWMRSYYGVSKEKPSFSPFNPDTDSGTYELHEFKDPSGFFKLLFMIKNKTNREVVFRRLYLEEKSRKIAKDFGVSENRISQRYRAAILELRKILIS